MIDAGSIGIKAVWQDQEARQSADRFYADMKRKRDEAMVATGGSTGAPGTTTAIQPAGRVDPGAWRINAPGVGGGTAVNASTWRGLFPAVGGGGQRGGGSDGAFLGGGLGGGGAGASGGIPDWLVGWRSPINPGQQAAEQSQAASRGLNLGRGPFGIRPMAAAYIAIRGATALASEYYRAADTDYAYRRHGEEAGLESDAAANQNELNDPLGRMIRSGLARNSGRKYRNDPLGNLIRSMLPKFESDEDKRDAIEAARSSVKDVKAAGARAASSREAGADVARFEQHAELSFIRDKNERRLTESKNAYENLRMELDNKLAAARGEATLNTDPLAQGRLDLAVKSTERNNARILSAAARAKGAEEAQINREAILNRHEIKANVEAARLEYEDRPRSAQAQRLFGKIKAEFEGGADKENAADLLRIGRFELMNMQKDMLRRGTAESYDPRGAAFGVQQTGKESIGEFNNLIKQFIKAIETWMPALK